MIDDIGILSAVTFLFDITAIGKLAENALHGALGDTDSDSQIPDANIRSFGQTQQNVCVIGQKSPSGSRLYFFRHSFLLPAERSDTGGR